MGVARSLRKLRILAIHGHRAEVQGSRKLKMRTRNLMNLDSGYVLRLFPSIYSPLYSTLCPCTANIYHVYISTHVNVDLSPVNLADATHLLRVQFPPASRLLVTDSDLA